MGGKPNQFEHTSDLSENCSTKWPLKCLHSFHIVVRFVAEVLPAEDSSSTYFRASKKELIHLNTCA
jgi:hypothetical protein